MAFTPSTSPSPPLLVALSGPTSSGKTTLARLLARIFPSTSILHADDYYHTDSAIPVHDGVQDWDCAEAINLPKLETTLRRIKDGEDVDGTISHVAGMEIPEGEGQIGQCDEVLEGLQVKVKQWEAVLAADAGEAWKRRRLVIVDGFLLLGPSVRSLRALFDVRILLRSRYEDSKRRREARSGYTTIEGWWEDPPGYFDRIVWPNYVKEHGFLFHGRDVQGKVIDHAAAQAGIDIVPGMGYWNLPDTLTWIVGLVSDRLGTSWGGRALPEHEGKTMISR